MICCEGLKAELSFKEKHRGLYEYLLETGLSDVVSVCGAGRFVAVVYIDIAGDRWGVIYVDNEIIEHGGTDHEFAFDLIADRLLNGEFE